MIHINLFAFSNRFHQIDNHNKLIYIELLKWSQPWLLLAPTASADLEDLVEADLVGLPHLLAARDDLE